MFLFLIFINSCCAVALSLVAEETDAGVRAFIADITSLVWWSCCPPFCVLACPLLHSWLPLLNKKCFATLFLMHLPLNVLYFLVSFAEVKLSNEGKMQFIHLYFYYFTCVMSLIRYSVWFNSFSQNFHVWWNWRRWVKITVLVIDETERNIIVILNYIQYKWTLIAPLQLNNSVIHIFSLITNDQTTKLSTKKQPFCF